jgi:4-amino-4-deoxy-L-arabinose transferase-like glycosyltransferase
MVEISAFRALLENLLNSAIKMTEYRKAWWISLIVKLFIASLIPLSADEAYYWVWSQIPQLSYYDHPPMIAWFFKLGSLLPNPLVRWPSVAFFHLSFLLWFKFLKAHLNEKQIAYWFYLCLLCPLTGLGSIILTPDLPLFVFFSLSLFFFFKALISRSLQDYAAFGASLGLGFLSKYIIVISALLFVASLIWDKKWIHFKIRPLSVMILTGLLFSLPVIVWNWSNDFKSFGFQLRHGLGENSWQWNWTTDYIFGSLLIIFPLNLARAWSAPRFSVRNIFSVLGFGGICFFLLSSFRGSVELNWPSIFIPCLFVLSARALKKNDLKINIQYWSIMYVLILVVSLTGFSPALKEKLYEPYKTKSWLSLPFEFYPLYGSTYQLSSLLWWKSQHAVYKLPGMSRYDFYDEIARPLEAKGFYLLMEKDNNLPEWLNSQDWEKEEVRKLDDKHLILKFTRKDSL